MPGNHQVRRELEAAARAITLRDKANERFNIVAAEAGGQDATIAITDGGRAQGVESVWV